MKARTSFLGIWIFTIAGLCVPAIVLFGVVGRAILENRASAAAAVFAETAGADATMPLDIQVKNVAAAVHKAYIAHQDATVPLLFKLRPYLASDLLPDFLKVPPGAIETLLIEGACDSAARTTAYILNSIGIDATQLNLVAPSFGHSIVQIQAMDGRVLAIDPAYGLMPAGKNGGLLTLRETIDRYRNGGQGSDIWLPIDEGASYHPIYDSFDEVWMAPQNAHLVWSVTMAFGGEDRIQIGTDDGRSDDVSSGTAARRMTPYWNYLGHKYDRGWVRRIETNVSARITFHLLGPASEGVLTADRPPAVMSRNSVTFEFGADDPLEFHDARARRNWRTLRSYVGVDWIEIERR